MVLKISGKPGDVISTDFLQFYSENQTLFCKLLSGKLHWQKKKILNNLYVTCYCSSCLIGVTWCMIQTHMIRKPVFDTGLCLYVSGKTTHYITPLLCGRSIGLTLHVQIQLCHIPLLPWHIRLTLIYWTVPRNLTHFSNGHLQEVNCRLGASKAKLKSNCFTEF